VPIAGGGGGDVAAPTTAATVAPPPNAAGWNNGDVVVALAAVDDPGGSGVKQTAFSAIGAEPIPATVVPGAAAAVPIRAEGQTTLTYFAADNAGNAETPTALTVRIDRHPPRLVFGALTPAPTSAGWNNTDVSIAFTVDDELSGVAATSTASPLLLSIEGGAVTGTITALDRADNGAAFTSPPARIDKTPPAVTFSGNAGRYTIDQRVVIACVATDPANANGTAGSGLATSTCPTINAPAYTFAPGVNTIAAAALDNAGNTASATATFTVDATAGSLCLLTAQLVESSPKFATLPPSLRARVGALLTVLCEHLASLTRTATAAGKARILAAYRAGVDELRSAGWLTASQAAVLIAYAGVL